MPSLTLTDNEKKLLLLAVRHSIEERLFAKPQTSAPDLSAPVFGECYGLFVTLTLGGRLRGCIGYIEGVKPLREAVYDMAQNAAFHDPRFYPLTEAEYAEISVEISVIFPLEDVSDINTIKPGQDGLYISRGFHSGLLLPQVATEYGWDRLEFLNQTCRKAGLEAYAWENGAKIKKFTALVWNKSEA